MKLSARIRYATRIMVNLASRTEPATREQIAEEEGITKAYVDKLLQGLKRAGMVRSIRGPAGGYLLDHDPRTIKVSDIYETMEGPMYLAPCQGEGCERQANCTTSGVWSKATAAFWSELEKETIADLAAPISETREGE